MTLAGRLSAFFLGALAVVLAGFSLSLYLLARDYLHRAAEDKLRSALDTLAAAAEVRPDGVEWEPNERQLFLGRGGGPDQIRWTVRDDKGRPVDRSRNLDEPGLLNDPGPAARPQPSEGFVRSPQGEVWRVLRRRVAPDKRGRPNKEEAGPGARVYPALVVTAGLPLEPVRAALRNLALILAGLSAGLWLLAAGLGRWLCRRALAPVARMAAAAQAMKAEDRDRRLPAPGTGDELEGLGRAFNDLLARLQEAYERQKRFTGDASHQLRTPLTAMLGHLEVALRRDRPPEDYRRALAVVQDQARRLLRVVEMLLFLARADAEARLPDLEPLDLGAWLADYARNWAGHPRAADLRVEAARDVPRRVRAQPALLGQLVDNLVDNALKYSPPGTPVTLRLAGEDGAVVLEVEDQGGGIAPADLPHVFEPFYRAARSDAAGVGLGLAVARRIATAFGGSLRADSEAGRGSRFRLRLPQDRENPAGRLPAAPALSFAPGQPIQ